MATSQMPKYVLDGDIAKCFDKINHEQLLIKLNTFPTLRRQIKAWLKSGVMDGKELFATSEGTPQGGVISPLLANIALHGMEERIKQYAETLKGRKQANRKSLSLIRYADDFVILHKDITVVQRCKEIISEWLKDMGLELKPSKTRLAHTLLEYENEKPGFDFLGFNIRQYEVGKCHSDQGFKTLIKPSKKSQKIHNDRITEIVENHKAAPQEALISRLNPVIRGWSNYYSAVVSKEVFSKQDYLMYEKLYAWAKRRHPNKINNHEIVDKYWISDGERNWVFATKYEGKISAKLLQHSDRAIVRHVKVKGEASPYNGDLVYWSTRLGKNPLMSTRVSKLLKSQKGKCLHCGLYFRDSDVMEVDHIVPKSLGGKDDYKNLQLLHRHCHDVKTTKDGSLKSKNTFTGLEEDGSFTW